jgi:hypothetical protein
MKKINYLQFTAVDGEAKIGLSARTSPDVQYSFDEKNWIVWDYKEITIPVGSTVYLKGNNPNGFSKGTFDNNHFMMQGKIEAHGNIMSLIYGEHCDAIPTIPNSCCFESLFEGCKSLLTAPEMPATTLTEGCYQFMYRWCFSLSVAPELPAKELRWGCYKGMFYGCTSLVKAPSLPALNLADCCYSYMFMDCESLIKAPELPATNLAEFCYASMFEGCESLVMAPKLPASDLQPECYKRMFFGCKKLEYVYALFEDQFHQLSTRSWLSGVRRKGLFVKSPRANWSDRGTSGIPKGWKVRTNFKPYRLPDGTYG